MSVPTFVVGTGRCGSTMLSNMLREHPHVLSLSEFFSLVADGGRTPEPFCAEPMDGRRFWSIAAAFTPFSNFALRQGVPCEELLYPCEAPASRFSWRTGVPAILITCLPHLTADHDALFHRLQAEVSGWPSAAIGDHYNRLFGWLAGHFDKQLWVERSGGGLAMARQFLATFPDARLVHIVRDGRAAALSMQEHLGFRMYLILGLLEQFLGVDPLGPLDRDRAERVPMELRAFLPERFDAEAFLAFRTPLALCGQLWSQQIDDGLKVLRNLPADRLLTLRYEDFFVDPKGQLDRLAAFLGDAFIDEDWSTRCAATVRPPRSTWRDLPQEEAQELAEVCRPGFERLAAAGVKYEI